MKYSLIAVITGIVTAATLSLTGPCLASAVCPKDKMGVNIRPQNSTPGKGVTDKVLGQIDLSKEPIAVAGRLFRLRKLVIQPGGVVPWHSHMDRPAIIIITKGTIVEYASNCSVPIVHHTGDVTEETHMVSHWWRNETKKPVELYATDLFPTKMMGTPEQHEM
ncbi:MAG: cupin domain-containing protein [Hyphomicrobiales bacterium]|nr:cupin domain-containing protein [Hyphomicrobiales bacterium]